MKKLGRFKLYKKGEKYYLVTWAHYRDISINKDWEYLIPFLQWLFEEGGITITPEMMKEMVRPSYFIDTIRTLLQKIWWWFITNMEGKTRKITLV